MKRKYIKHKKTKIELAKRSSELAGCASLVWQRIHKLGWSYKRAITQPVVCRCEPRTCLYNGIFYPSMAACYRAIRPKVSLITFVRRLRRSGLVLGVNKHYRKSVKVKVDKPQ